MPQQKVLQAIMKVEDIVCCNYGLEQPNKYIFFLKSLFPGLATFFPSLHPSFPFLCPSFLYQFTHLHVNKQFAHKKINVSCIFSSATQSCPLFCDLMNCSMPGLPVHHQLPEFNQTHARRVGDAIQPSHPRSSPPPPAPNPSQHQGLFQ